MKLKVIQTSKHTNDRFADKGDVTLLASSSQNEKVLVIDKQTTYQKVMGFGGAFTESAAYTLAQVSSEQRAEVIKSYFNQEVGLGYSLGRTHIHSCDFALENYTYVEEHDIDLNTFSIDREKKLCITPYKGCNRSKGR